MNKTLSIIIFLVFLYGCEKQAIPKTPEMELEAKNKILTYLTKNELPHEGLNPFHSSVEPTPDFSYLYTGGGRCIHFIIYCHGHSCNDMSKYPYDRHGEQCPNEDKNF